MWLKRKDPAEKKAARVEGKKVFLNDKNPHRKYRRNISRIKQLKQRLGEIDSNHSQRDGYLRELKRRLLFVEEYEVKHNIQGDHQ